VQRAPGARQGRSAEGVAHAADDRHRGARDHAGPRRRSETCSVGVATGGATLARG
jgi:hypothetical protein